MAEEYTCSKVDGLKIIRSYNLHESAMGYLQGAIRQYRDSNPTNSLHVREYPDCFTIHRDTHNPELEPVEHFFIDVLKPESVFAGGLAFTLALAITEKPKQALLWGGGIGTLVQLIVDNPFESNKNERRITEAT